MENFRFEPKTDDDQSYIRIVKTEKGCSSWIGRQGGPQDVQLSGRRAFKRREPGVIIHELMHALGEYNSHSAYAVTHSQCYSECNVAWGCRKHCLDLYNVGVDHEHNRPDRDEYITILWQNIKEAKKYNFEICKDCTTLNTPYDINSVMHYDWKAMRKPRLFIDPTIERKDNPLDFNFGQREGFSNFDIAGINEMYGCSGS